MDIALFGASGTIGSRIATEAEARGHNVTRLRSADADVTDPAAVAHAIAGHDATVSAVGSFEDLQLLTRAAEALLIAAVQADVPRLVVVGGSGNLEVAPGQRLVDTPDFPAAWKPVALAQVAALDVYRANDTVDWTYVSPAALIEPGDRTGSFRIGSTGQLLIDDHGKSRITAEDYATAVINELESPQHVREYITVAY
jgi:uncharacterized protein